MAERTAGSYESGDSTGAGAGAAEITSTSVISSPLNSTDACTLVEGGMNVLAGRSSVPKERTAGVWGRMGGWVGGKGAGWGAALRAPAKPGAARTTVQDEGPPGAIHLGEPPRVPDAGGRDHPQVLAWMGLGWGDGLEGC